MSKSGIYCPNGAAAEYSTWACNLYNGCTHSCTYCYCKLGVLSHTLGKDQPCIKAQLGGTPESAYSIFCKELDKHREEIIAAGGLFFSFSTDPFLREEIELTMKCMGYAFSRSVPVTVLTKATWWVRNDEIISALYAHRDLLTIGFTLTGMDEMEPCAPSNVARQTALIYLSKMQFRTFASMEPVVSFAKSLAIICTIADDCPEFRIGLLSPYSRKRYDTAQAERFVQHVEALSRDKGFSVMWKKSFRRYCKECNICPNIQ